MSGGERSRKKMSRGAEGWEEAGGEFYQESYPSTDTDLDVLQRDPKQLHTLLPSKQTRAAAATMVRRVRAGGGNGDNTRTKTVRRQTVSRTRTRSRRDSTARRPSQAGDVHVAMLPDLSGDLSNEQTTWEEIMQIKALPITMAQKREMKAKLQSEPNLRLQGYEHFKWRRRRIWDRLRHALAATGAKFELWRGDLKRIEGHCGTGIVTYFLFIKWLIYLNCVLLTLILTFEIVPYLLLVTPDHAPGIPTPDPNCTNNFTNVNATFCLPTPSTLDDDDGSTSSDLNERPSPSTNPPPLFALVEGSGWLATTVFFQAFYTQTLLPIPLPPHTDHPLHYDFPLAYLLTTLACFLLSLIVIVRAAARDFRERLLEREGQLYRYCHLVFGGWPFCIDNEATARGQSRALYQEIGALLAAERHADERRNRTRQQRAQLLLVRFVVNVLVVVVLGACALAIYAVFEYASAHTHATASEQRVERLVYEYMPSLTIVGFNMVVPGVFARLVHCERYTQVTVVRVTLARTIFLRLFSLAVLYASLYARIVCPNRGECRPAHACWETLVGRHIYKLLLADFAVRIVVTFLINWPRALLARRSNSRLAKWLGEQQFALPAHALDIIYAQTLCWLGLFYAPLLPALAIVTFFLTFYVKKFACLVNCQSSTTTTTTIYRVSRSNAMYMGVLLLSYACAVVPVMYAMAELVPSVGCGPFRGLASAWQYLAEWFDARTSWWVRGVAEFMTTATFATPIFIALLLLLYYYWTVSGANRHMVAALKNQLVLEGHDKQFLLDRLSVVVRQQHDMRKRMMQQQQQQQGEMVREGERIVSSN